MFDRLSESGAIMGKPRIFIITGNEGLRHKEYAAALGADMYLEKPFTAARFFGIASRLLRDGDSPSAGETRSG